MKMETAKEIIACLPDDKTAFRYCRDRYAVFLLTQVMGGQCPVRVLDRSIFAKLLSKPLISPIVDKSGYGVLYQQQLESLWTINTETFLLTLDTWGYDDRNRVQVSRTGVSLVLQLNFSNKHDAMFRALAKPEDHYFNGSGHPVLRREKRGFFRETLAWARIDLDFSTDEALIEELQTDWIRSAIRLSRNNSSARYRPELNEGYGVYGERRNLSIYLEDVIQNYGAIWDEALLTATLQFIRHELGIGKIYLHTPESGAAVKKIDYRQPPRSIYSDLPKQFCFSKTGQAPEFLCRDAAFRRLQKKLGGTRWNYLNLGEHYANITQTATEKSGSPVALAA